MGSIVFREFFSLFFSVLNIINYLFAFFIVYYERRNIGATWAWLIVVLITPYFGFIFFLLFGLDARKHKVFYDKAHRDNKTYKEMLIDTENSFTDVISQTDYKSETSILGAAYSSKVNDMIYLNYISGGSFLTKNNAVQMFHTGNDKFTSLLADIESAKHFIHIQYYIFRNDNLGQRLIKVLAKKASEGIEVRLLVDGMGNYKNGKKFYNELVAAGGELGVFMPPYFIRINFRNHRKLCIIDGAIGYIGGFNVGDEYLGEVRRYGNWRDTHIKVIGDAVKEMQIRFMMDWAFVRNETLPFNELYLPKIDKPIGTANMQIVSSGPDSFWSSIQYGYTKMISEASKNIFIVTPYFVPDDSIFESLRIAALSGVDVRIIIPANPDHIFVYGASLSYLGALIAAGVKCYKYENGFVHSKLLMIDGLISSVGTANMDLRSFKLNFEINAFIYDEEATKEMEREFFNDLEHCTLISSEWYNNRPLITRCKEAVGRLISPLL